MAGFNAFDDGTTGQQTQISGVHEAPTQPAPYVEEAADSDRVGSVPLSSLSVLYQPVLQLDSGRPLGFEATPSCSASGLEDPEELFARAIFEQKAGELGRHLRALALQGCIGTPLYINVHPNELKESWLIRPDDPICAHDAEVFLEVGQSVYSKVCMHVLTEVRSRSGISLVLDDLGAGVSTLAQVVELQPTAAKLDPALVEGLDQSKRKQRMLKGLVSMCGDLGVALIAKGVDSEAVRYALLACGIRYGQGYALGAPSSLPGALGLNL